MLERLVDGSALGAPGLVDGDGQQANEVIGRTDACCRRHLERIIHAEMRCGALRKADAFRTLYPGKAERLCDLEFDMLQRWSAQLGKAAAGDAPVAEDRAAALPSCADQHCIMSNSRSHSRSALLG